MPIWKGVISMKASIKQAQAQVNKLKQSGIGNLIKAVLVLYFSDFEGCTEKDNYYIPLRCTKAEAMTLQRRQRYNNGTLPNSD